MAIADLAANGVFARHPDLRLGIMELTARWVPLFLRHLDGAFDFHRRFEGRPLADLPRSPSEEVQAHVRVAAFADEDPASLAAASDDLYMFCSDYPHAEGSRRPVEDYRPAMAGLPERRARRLASDNVRWLLRET